ncbi:unnamed protein product [Rotaria sordida]|uniref:Helix-turn-helix domain-containing protein n=2 Tax=Rotaria sordida TaxID=392033 RepID=A0A819HHY0_9BILA|nr:unnamed protein product [Rotaria sordida]
MRAQREFRLVKSIRRKARKAKLIIRVCDKGGGLHIGSKSDYERKAAKYREDTKAYQELSYNPLKEMITNKGTPLRPILNTIKAVTRPISDFLDELIRPIYNEYNKDNTFTEGVDLIKCLEKYAADGHLKPQTLFCTFDINNLYTMLPQDESIRILGDFLRQHVGERVKSVSVTTIQKLAEFVQKENAFIYDNKFYKQIIGGAMGSPFTLTSANIFMWHWEKRWVRRQQSKKETYGRVSFLDVLVSNNNGALYTSVYHKPSAEPYVVPFISDHPRYTFTNIIQTALVRAIRYSSTFEAFNIERRAIRLMLSLNGYPSIYIDQQFRKVLGYSISSTSILPLIDNEGQFFQLRKKLMGQPTSRQSQVEGRIAQSKDDNAEYPVK